MPWQPGFRSDLAQNLIQPFPYPNDASDKILLRSVSWLQRYSNMKVLTDARIDGRAGAGSMVIL